MKLAPLRLKKDEDRRLRIGHLWVFSNEVDTQRTPLSAFEPGQPVLIESSQGMPLGSGYVNPAALICARLVTRRADRTLDAALLERRLRQAFALREQLFSAPFYRLVFSEADWLPGLVVDRYGDILVVQLTTAGMERVKATIIEVLQALFGPKALVLRNDGPSRTLEGLPSYVETVGPAPEAVALEENGVRFEVSMLAGQKTGWFYDQRPQRTRMRGYVLGRRVLDAFSYIGAWGIQAAAAGAAEVVCLDSSAKALAQLERNALLNGVESRVRTVQGDALESLKGLARQFDVVILDPPAFIKRKKDQAQGEQAYLRLNELGMRCLRGDGILMTSSCSYHLSAERLQEILLRASRNAECRLQLLEQGGQGPDHPVHPAIPETRYLKAFFTRILP